MSNRFGYACLNVTLGRRGGFRGMIKRTWMKEGLPHASRLALENSEILCGIIEWNNRNGIQVYRMTSDLVPWASEYELEQLPDWSKIQANYRRAASLAAIGNQRLSFHPGHFNSLTSHREHVVRNCVRDLKSYGCDGSSSISLGKDQHSYGRRFRRKRRSNGSMVQEF